MKELEKVIEIVANVTDVPEESISADTKFVDDLQADSLDIAEIIMNIEDVYGINIPDEEINKQDMTVGEVAEKLESMLG